MKRVLTIGGSDPSSGAGIQRDLLTFAELGVYGMSAITSITVQDKDGLRSRSDLEPEVVIAQVQATASAGIDAIKTGMLATARIVHAVADAVSGFRDIPIVVDPVMLASAGGRLLDEDGVDVLKKELLPLATVVTPNLEEASTLAGFPVIDDDSQARACEVIRSFGPRGVIVTGGHLDDEPVDVLCDDNGTHRVKGSRVLGRTLHGTGCRYSAALAADLARGMSLRDAASRAKGFVASAIAERG